MVSIIYAFLNFHIFKIGTEIRIVRFTDTAENYIQGKIVMVEGLANKNGSIVFCKISVAEDIADLAEYEEEVNTYNRELMKKILPNENFFSQPKRA